MSTRTILIADEDIDTRIILRAFLERAGFRVIEAANGASAKAAAEQHPLTLVVLNHPMYVAPSTTLATWLRTYSATRDVPIINLTSRAIPAYLDDARAQGVTVNVAKPLDVRYMLQIIDELTAAVPA